MKLSCKDSATMDKNDFFLVYRTWSNKLICYVNGKLAEYTERQFDKIENLVIEVEGKAYLVSKAYVTKR